MKQRRLPTLEELKRHVVDLCAAFNVKLVLVADLAQRPERAVSHQLIAKKGGETLAMLVECAPIVDETTYAVALHEIGHCVAPNGHFIGITEDYQMRLIAEEAAWEWAKWASLDWTPTMEQNMLMSVGTYRKRAQQLRTEKAQLEQENKNREQREARRTKALKNWTKRIKL